MIDYQTSDVLLSGTDKDIEFFTLLRTGHLILRYRLYSGVLCETIQHYADLHTIVRQFGGAIRVKLVPLPETLHQEFSVPFVAGLRLSGADVWIALFPFMPCSLDKVLKLIGEGPETFSVGASSQFAMSPEHLDERRLSAFGPALN